MHFRMGLNPVIEEFVNSTPSWQMHFRLGLNLVIVECAKPSNHLTNAFSYRFESCNSGMRKTLQSAYTQ